MSETKESKSNTVDRADVTDLGVPMLPGDGSEPQGPEDALGSGPKRGDYSDRIGPASYQPHEILPVEAPAPGEPKAESVKQRERVADIGEVAGEKGGVTTS